MKTIIIISLILVSMFFTSCNETSTNNNPIEIIPLNIGNKWLYSVKSLDDSVVKANQILKDTLLQGEKWFIMNLDGVPVFIAQNKPDGLWIFRKSTAYPDGKAVLFYKYPAKVGDSYDIDTIKISVLSIRDTIQVIGGTYTCYHYQTLYGQQEKYDEYLAPGIGAIKLLAYKFVSGQWQLVETTEFISAILK